MGDGHDGAGVVLQRALEPGDRVGVEVVRGLVEQEEVGLREQDAGQGDAAPFATGQVGDGGVAGWAAERVHRDVDHAIGVVAAVGRHLGLEFGLLGADLLVVGVGVGVAGEHRVVLLLESDRVADAVHHVAADVFRLVEVWLLGQVADGVAGGEAGHAVVLVVQAGHDLQQ